MPENADAYQRTVSQEVLPGFAARNLDGYHGAYLLRLTSTARWSSPTIMLFDSLAQVHAFAGETRQIDSCQASPNGQPGQAASQPAMERGGLCLMTHHDGDLGHRLLASHRGVLQDGEE